MSQTIEGYFDRIGSLIDPIRHTGLVMGWVPNESHHLRPGQFITASVLLPDEGTLVSVPGSAIVDLDAQPWLLVQDPKAPERFIPTQVEVVRFHDGMACLRPQSAAGAGVPVGVDSTVVSTGAVEILAEFQMRRKAQAGAEEQ
jgi:multidrug efflux pump subunit AcrA (membrane-fusion protein)